MKTLFGLCSLFIAMLGFFVASPLEAQDDKEAIRKRIAESQVATEAFLKLLDQGEYGQSWDFLSPVAQETVKKSEWVNILNSSRKPMGSVISRTIADVRTATNPPGLPQGQYMVFVYKTEFANKKNAIELITLQQQSNGVWKVLTYQTN